MPDNRTQVLHRLKSVRKKMTKESKYCDDYLKFMKKLFDAGHTRMVPNERLHKEAWYIPHHGVYHPMKKKFRVVFDCSAEKDVSEQYSDAGTRFDEQIFRGITKI